MKKLFLLLFCILPVISCVKQYQPKPQTEKQPAAEVERLLTTEEYQVEVREGYVTQVTIDGDLVAEAVTPMTIMIPKMGGSTAVRSEAGPQLNFVPLSEYPNNVQIENRAKLYQVVCFEDSHNNDYDYNDLVFHVIYKVQGNRFGFAVHPIALGSSKPIKLGCAVYKGNNLVFKGLLASEGVDCRKQYFESQEGFINTIGDKINQSNGGWNSYLASTIRSWQMNKIEGEGAMRVEWYIQVDGDRELFALSTNYLDQSFDKNHIPYGLVITETGSQYTDENGIICGKDWFNYPKENCHINQVYPEIWKWITTDQSFTFRDIYDRYDVPENAFPASDLGLYLAPDVDVFNPKYAQN